MTKTPKCTTYSIVVERETVQITLTIAALNDLQVEAGNMMNVSSPAGTTKDMNGTRPEGIHLWLQLPQELTLSLIMSIKARLRKIRYMSILYDQNEYNSASTTLHLLAKPFAFCLGISHFILT